MLAKLKITKYLKAQADDNAAKNSFVLAVHKLARVPHFGLRDRVNRRGYEIYRASATWNKWRNRGHFERGLFARLQT